MAPGGWEDWPGGIEWCELGKHLFAQNLDEYQFAHFISEILFKIWGSQVFNTRPNTHPIHADAQPEGTQTTFMLNRTIELGIRGLLERKRESFQFSYQFGP